MRLRLSLASLVNGTLLVCALVVTTLLVNSELRKRTSSGQGQVVNRFLDSIPSQHDYFAGGQRLGPADGPPALVVFSDYECPACRLFHVEIEDRRKRGDHNLPVSYRHWPLPNHRNAEKAAVASECAARQGRFSAMHDSLFQRQRELSSVAYDELAQSAGVLDLGAFNKCMVDPNVQASVRADAALAATLRSLGTPTVLVRGGTGFAGILTGAALDSLLGSLAN